MTNPVAPPNIIPVPTYPALGSPSFNQEAYTYATTMPSVTVRLHEIAVAAYTNAVAANERSVASIDAANTAIQQADAALGYRNSAQSAAATATTQAGIATAAATSASKLNLGSKTYPPTVDNQGATLLVGATYFDVSLGKWRVWNGTAWVEGVSAVAGVSSVNGRTGSVTLSHEDVGATSLADVEAAIAGKANSDSPHLTGGVKVTGTISGSVIEVTGTDINCASGNFFFKSISSNTALTFTNLPAAGDVFGMVVEIHLTGGTVTWPSTVRWPGNIAPAPKVNKKHLFYFLTADGGAKWKASSLLNYED